MEEILGDINVLNAIDIDQNYLIQYGMIKKFHLYFFFKFYIFSVLVNLFHQQ